MNQWEYLYIVADRDEVFKINEQIVERMDLPGYLNEIGQQGWEMVGITTEGAATGYWRMVFKRLHATEKSYEHAQLGQILQRMNQISHQQTQITQLVSRMVKK